MFDKFTEFAEANNDHFNDHFVAYTALTVVGIIGSVAVAHKLAKRIAGTPSTAVIPMPK